MSQGRPSLLVRILKWAVALTLLSCGCCGLGLTVCAGAVTNADFTVPSGEVDLGTAAHPEVAVHPVKAYRWEPNWNASTHLVRYILDSAEASDLELAFHTHMEENARRCLELSCAYDYIWESNEAAIAPLAERFAQRIFEAQLGQDEAAALIVSFVQEIPYQIPKEQPFEVLPPALVASYGRGDCDSKAILAIMLLRSVGIPSALLISLPLQHAAVGIALPGSGAAFPHGGRRYRYTEITATGWPIGHMPPEWNKPHLWSVLWVGGPER